jgi:MFS transporter, SP family, general alpha glucoside:H+ symporter
MEAPSPSKASIVTTNNVEMEYTKPIAEPRHEQRPTMAAKDVEGDANEAAQVQTAMSLTMALKQYPKAAAWSILFSTTIVMLAYDTILLNSFYAYPSFQRKYGVCHTVAGKTKCQIPAKWQSGLSNGSNVGGIIGLMLNGYVADKYGYGAAGVGRSHR